MKKEVHPELHPVCFVDIATGKQFLTRAAMTSEKKEVIDGVEYNMVDCSVTADSHPAYTGEKRLVDTAGRIEKFNKKYARK